MPELVIQTAPVFAPLLENVKGGKPVRFKAVHGGRGSGKSRFFAGLLVEEMIAEPLDFVCLREVQRSLKFSVKREIESAIESMNAGSYFEVQDRQILGKTGGTCIFEGMQNHTATSIQSLARFHRAWIEEAQGFSQNSLDILRPTIREPGSQIWCSWNPRSHLDAVDQFFKGAAPPRDAVIVQANYTDNPWFPATLKSEMEHDQRAASPEKFAHIWRGEYQRLSEARVFRNWVVEEFDTADGALFRYGADWGFAIDPSVLVRCYLVGRKLYIDHEAYQVGCEIDRLPDLFMQIPEAEKWPVVADSSRPETISYMQRNGFPRMRAAIKGARSVEEGVAFMQGLEIVVHPRCKHTIDELSSYRYKVDPATNEPIPILHDSNNHVIDALRYACEGARRAASSKPKAPATVVRREYVPHQGGGGWMG